MTDSNPITRLNTALEGRYRIESELGEGGMATVYLAHDLKHERRVALKVLKPELAAVVGAERFLVEIKTTANLQHPHILPLFDSGEAEGFLFYVMPYVEGETLRDRLERDKQLPVDEAVRIATDVAEALHMAHGHGVIHRDIKPANILMSNGRPLVADFGIALAVSAAGGGRLTETGLSMGTPYYMSPEQASADREPSAASDVYSVGCVLYEMLVGEPPYTGGSAQAILAKILMGDTPNPTLARPAIPANVDAAIRKALEKLPADRFSGAHDLARALADQGFHHGNPSVGTLAGPTGSWNRLTIGFATAAVAFAGLAAWAGLQPAPSPRTTRSVMDMEGIALLSVAELVVSPDGSRFAFGGDLDGQRGVFWREAADEAFRFIPGTEGARSAVSFSPDGQHLAYANRGTLMRVTISGGAPRPLFPREAGVVQIAWGHDGHIYFGVNGPGLYRVPEGGGPPETLLETMGGISNPRLLPDGEGVLFTDDETLSTKLFDMKSDSVFELIPEGIDAMYVETGHLLYADQLGTLWAVAFDPARRETTGTPMPVLDGLSIPRQYFARYSVSQTGTVIYSRGRSGDLLEQLVVLDHDGRQELLGMAPRDITQVGWAPNGREVVFTSEAEGGGDSQVFTYDIELNSLARQLTFEGNHSQPVVSPDGTQVVFASRREGTDGLDLFVKSLVDDGPERTLITLEGDQKVSQWPSDSLILFEHEGSGDFGQIWTLDLADPDAPVATRYLTGDVPQSDMALSPDGTLAAYKSRASGQSEIYVSSFPVPGAPTMVSEDGGAEPFWAPDGNTLYYAQPAGGARFTAARLTRSPALAVLSRQPLFTLRMSQPSLSALHPDGDRWIAAVQANAADPTSAADRERTILAVNWFTELRERAEGN